MPAVAEDAANSITASVARRWQDNDPLLPLPVLPPPGCGASFVATVAEGQPAAVATCRHSVSDHDSMDTAWGTARRFNLTTAVAGPDVRGALDQLLAQWRAHLADMPGTGDDDSSAIVNWPSRDIDGVAALVRRGLSPMVAIGARANGRHPGAAGPAAGAMPRGTAIRRAGPADAEAVARLGLEVVRFDAHFGNGGEQPGTLDGLRKEAASLLAGPEPWTWLAERDGEPVGLVAAQRPEAAGWIAPVVRLAPAAYLMLMFVRPGERGGGIGAELVARLHRDIDAAGAPVTLLHYQLLNPLSAPFWSQQGYRPLWAAWEARPARALR